MNSTLLYNDVKEAIAKFPKLEYRLKTEYNSHALEGELDICDKLGNYRGSFEIMILLPINYPFGVPIVVEKSNHIPRDRNWHVSSEGVCCLDIDHKLLFASKSGIKISEFIGKWVYSFFANYIYRSENKEYANGEYAHEFAGIKQFYLDDLRLSDSELILKILNQILVGSVPKKYDRCLCGNGKRFDKCHFEVTYFLSALGNDRIKMDIEGFSNSGN